VLICWASLLSLLLLSVLLLSVSQMPKYKLLLGAAFGKKWEEGEVLRPLEQLSQAQVAAFQEYRQEVVEERSLDPLRVSGGLGVCVWGGARLCEKTQSGRGH
jgi:hypothetical protein